MKRRTRWLVIIKVYFRDEDGKLCEGTQTHHVAAWDKYDAIKRTNYSDMVDRKNKDGKWTMYKIIKRETISVEEE